MLRIRQRGRGRYFFVYFPAGTYLTTDDGTFITTDDGTFIILG